jgi:hypothetical protein
VQVLYDKGLANHIGLEPCEGLREEADEKSVGARVGGVSRRESCLSRAPTLVGGRKATSRSTEPRVLLDLCAVRVPTRGGCHGAASRCLRLPMACWPRTYERIDRWRNAGCGGKPARPGADRDGQRAFLPLDNVPAIPTVSLDVVSLVASSCGHYGGISSNTIPRDALCPPASPLFASWPWPRHHVILVGTHARPVVHGRGLPQGAETRHEIRPLYPRLMD